MDYYGDNEPTTVAWMKELIAAGHLPAGVVDGKDIQEVRASDLAGYRRCHFFAGIGGWAYALQLAGWPADRPVWTGSCPCQPFSSAGKRKGKEDSRHVWPEFFRLIGECRPATVFGEQVASDAGRNWLAGVFDDLETLGYAVAGADLPACSQTAPHQRQRLFWVADTQSEGRRPHTGAVRSGPAEGLRNTQRQDERRAGKQAGWIGDCGSTGDLANAERSERRSDVRRRLHESDREGQERQESERSLTGSGADAGALDHSDRGRLGQRLQPDGDKAPNTAVGNPLRTIAYGSGPAFWSDFDIIPCRDDKARRVESASQCLVDGLSVELAHRWIESLQEIKKEVIHYGASTSTGPTEVLRALRAAVHQEFLRWAVGRSDRFQEAAVLFAALCELSRELGNVIDGQASGIAETLWPEVREMRTDGEPARSPHGQRLSKQRPRELADLVRELSQKIAPIASDIAALILHGYPLAHGLPGRVGLLRGYGNAIVPQVAAAFVRAYLDVTD